MQSKLSAFPLFLCALFITAAASAETIDADWMDPNYAFCEDVGVHGTGRVQATAKVDKVGTTRRISSLSVTTTHAHPHSMSGTLSWKSPEGIDRSTALQAPWFQVIAAPGSGQMLILPRSGGGAGPQAQTVIQTALNTPVKIRLTVLFHTTSGVCPTTFEQSWNL